MESGDSEEVKRIGNEMYKRGSFVDALRLYDRAITLSPGNASYRSNRAAALSGLGRLGEAVRECEEAVKLDPVYSKAHQRLGSLFFRAESLLKLQSIEDADSQLIKCPEI